MTKFVIKLGLADYSDAGLLAFCQSVATAMTANANYTTPVPTIISLGTLISAFSDAITAWGPEGNRGSHLQHQQMLDARADLETAMTTLANYCMTTTVYNKTAFLSGGWEVKRESVPVGLVGPVQNFHQFISRTVPSGAVKLSWTRPEGVARKSIAVYRVFHGFTADVNAATQMGLTTKTTFTDLEAGNRSGNFYWVIPFTVAGDGGVSDVVQGYPVGPVVS